MNNYTLYANYRGCKVKIFSDTLENIDKFTSYFSNKFSIKRMLLKRDLQNLDIYVESPKGNKYDIVYYNSRPIIEKRNNQKIYDKIKKISSQDIDKYFFDKCNLEKCIESKNAKNIKIVGIHNKIISNQNYFCSLYNYLINDYKSYRNLIIYFFKYIDLNNECEKVPLNEKMKIVKIMNEAKAKINEIFENIDIYDIEDPEEDYFEDFIDNIINNKFIDKEQKINEIDMLFESKNKSSMDINEYKKKL